MNYYIWLKELQWKGMASSSSVTLWQPCPCRKTLSQRSTTVSVGHMSVSMYKNGLLLYPTVYKQLYAALLWTWKHDLGLRELLPFTVFPCNLTDPCLMTDALERKWEAGDGFQMDLSGSHKWTETFTISTAK